MRKYKEWYAIFFNTWTNMKTWACYNGLMKGIPIERLTLNNNNYLDGKIISDRFGYIIYQEIRIN